MGTQVHERTTHQRHNPNLRVGKPKLVPRAASKLEINQLNTAISCLKRARTAETEQTLMMNVQEAFRLLRAIHRSRNDV